MAAALAVQSASAHKILYPLVPQPSSSPSRVVSWKGLTPLEMVEAIAGLVGDDDEASSSVSLHATNFDVVKILGRLRAGEYPETTSCPGNAGKKRKCGIEGYAEETPGIEYGGDDDDDDEVDAILLACGVPSRHPTRLKLPVEWNSLPADFVKIVGELADEHPWIVPSLNRCARALYDSGFSGSYARALETAETQLATLQKMAAERGASDKHEANSDVQVTERTRCIGTGAKQQYEGAAGLITLSGTGNQSPAVPCRGNTSNRSDKVRRSIFQTFVRNFVSRNFVNPFPDELQVATIAHSLVEQDAVATSKTDEDKLDQATSVDERVEIMMKIAIEKVSINLINQRARKWRPCIEAVSQFGVNVSHPTKPSRYTLC